MIHHGDLFNVLPTLAAESIDACVTDPPYDLTANKRGGSGTASINLDSPYGRARIGTGNGSGGFMGKAWDGTGVAFDPATWREVSRVLKPGAHLVAFGGTRTFHRMTVAIEDAGFEIRDCLSWLYSTGFPKSLNLPGGLGTALKPSWEPIILARKPTRGTVAANVAAYGTGAMNVDACRIGNGGQLKWSTPRDMGYHGGSDSEGEATDNTLGRWPANVLLDEDAAAALDEMTGELRPGHGLRRNTVGLGANGIYGRSAATDSTGPSDFGGASRFYYVAKPSREERDMGCHDLAPQTAATITGRKPGSAGLNNPRAGVRAGSSQTDPNRRAVARNIHPTVKPVELMRWLVRLVTPPGGTVLDPFCGSGTTGVACAYELRRFVGVEREVEYVEIAERRIADAAPLFQEDSA